MRIIHTADLHLESKMEKNMSTFKSKERRKELIIRFQELIEYSNKNDVSIIIISGDFFDKPNVSNTVINHIRKLIISNENIDFIYAKGNHDLDLVSDAMKDIKNFYTFSDNWQYYKYNNLCISGISFNQKTNKYLYDTLSLNKEDVNIVMMHGEVSLYDIDNKINIKRLINKNIDYLALGHIHTYTSGSIDDRGVYVYSGCLEGRGFDEVGEKGFVLIEINNNNINYSFIPFSKRVLHEIDFDITGLDSSMILINLKNNIRNISSNDMIKVNIIGEYEIDFYKDFSILEDYLNSNYYFGKIKDLTKLKFNEDDYKNDYSLKGEFIKNVINNSSITEEDKNKIIEYGLKVLSGGDL